MIEAGVTPKWQAQVRTDVARDPELLELMRKSGCHRVALGFESIDQDTLDSYDKSQTVEDITDCIKALHKHGIKCHGMFVVGADSDTAQTVRETVAFAERHGIDSLMLNVLTPGLGTKQYEQMDAGNRIFENRWQFYDGQHVIFVPRQMTPLELQTAVVNGYRHFYSLRQGQVPRPPSLRQPGRAPLGLALHPPLAEGPRQPGVCEGTGRGVVADVDGRSEDFSGGCNSRHSRPVGGMRPS
jgi:radical SAM superfamily enzyme YgiQ (UPF0313 family)